MDSLSIKNIKEYCRTCLKNLNKSKSFDNFHSFFVGKGIASDELKQCQLAIRIQDDKTVLELIDRYINIDLPESFKKEETDFPPNICLQCYNNFQSFDKFRKYALKCTEKLVKIYSAKSVKTFDGKANSMENIHSLMVNL